MDEALVRCSCQSTSYLCHCLQITYTVKKKKIAEQLESKYCATVQCMIEFTNCSTKVEKRQGIYLLATLTLLEEIVCFWQVMRKNGAIVTKVCIFKKNYMYIQFIYLTLCIFSAGKTIQNLMFVLENAIISSANVEIQAPFQPRDLARYHLVVDVANAHSFNFIIQYSSTQQPPFLSLTTVHSLMSSSRNSEESQEIMINSRSLYQQQLNLLFNKAYHRICWCHIYHDSWSIWLCVQRATSASVNYAIASIEVSIESCKQNLWNIPGS